MKKIFLLLFVATIGVASATLLVVVPEDAPPDVRAARAACSDADRFAAIVDDDGPAADATAALARAIVNAKRAVALDPSWAPLQSGLETLELSLEEDDAGAANVGARVVDANCARAREKR